MNSPLTISERNKSHANRSAIDGQISTHTKQVPHDKTPHCWQHLSDSLLTVNTYINVSQHENKLCFGRRFARKHTHTNRKIDEIVMVFLFMFPFSVDISLHLQYVLDSKCACHFMTSFKRGCKSKTVFLYPHAHSVKEPIGNLLKILELC